MRTFRPYYTDTNIEVEPGDLIKWIKANSKKCKYRDKIYTISKLSKASMSVWFDNPRTNNKCRCHICRGLLGYNSINVGISNIKLHTKGLTKKRNDKIKRLLK